MLIIVQNLTLLEKIDFYEILKSSGVQYFVLLIIIEFFNYKRVVISFFGTIMDVGFVLKLVHLAIISKKRYFILR